MWCILSGSWSLCMCSCNVSRSPFPSAITSAVWTTWLLTEWWQGSQKNEKLPASFLNRSGPSSQRTPHTLAVKINRFYCYSYPARGARQQLITQNGRLCARYFTCGHIDSSIKHVGVVGGEYRIIQNVTNQLPISTMKTRQERVKALLSDLHDSRISSNMINLVSWVSCYS